MSVSLFRRRTGKKQGQRRGPNTAHVRPLGLEVLEPRLVLYAVTGQSWGNPNVSFSFLPDGTLTEGYASSLFAELNAIAPTATWQREFARGLQTWANVSNLNFRLVADDGSPTGTSGLSQGDSRFGDIRLGAHPLTNGYVGYAYFPSSTTKGGDITLSPDATFRIGTYLDLYSVLLHEAGHALGLNHSTSGTVMYGTISSVYAGLTADDIAGIRAIYGARQADVFDASAANDGFAFASALTVNSSGSFAAKLDLTSMADVDYYRLTVPTGSDGTATFSVDARNLSLLAPKVLVYDSADNLVATGQGAYGTVATVSLTGLSAGQSYTLVADGATADAFGMGAYWLNAEFGLTGEQPPPPPPPVPPPTIAADSFEVNDTFATAKNLGKLNNFSKTGLTIHTATDMDYDRWTVQKGGTFNVSVQFAQANGNLDLAVYDADQNVLGRAASLTDNESLTLKLATGQRNYLEVLSPDGSLNTYDLAISKVGGGKGGGANGAQEVGHGSYALGSGEPHEHEQGGHGHRGDEAHAWAAHTDAAFGTFSKWGVAFGSTRTGSLDGDGELDSMWTGASDGANDPSFAPNAGWQGSGPAAAGVTLTSDTALDVDSPSASLEGIAEELAGNRNLDGDVEGEEELHASGWLSDFTELPAP